MSRGGQNNENNTLVKGASVQKTPWIVCAFLCFVQDY